MSVTTWRAEPRQAYDREWLCARGERHRGHNAASRQAEPGMSVTTWRAQPRQAHDREWLRPSANDIAAKMRASHQADGNVRVSSAEKALGAGHLSNGYRSPTGPGAGS